MYFVYVLRSLADKKFYVGFTTDVPKRYANHAAGRVTSTRSRLPFELVYFEAYRNKLDALGREKFLKGGSGHKFLYKQLSHYFNESP